MLPDKLPSLRDKIEAKAEAEAEAQKKAVLEGEKDELVKVKKSKKSKWSK